MLCYSLFIKSNLWDKTKKLIIEFMYIQLIAAAIEIKEINQYTDLAILALK